MIIILAKDDPDIVAAANQCAVSDAGTFGMVYTYGDDIPLLGPNEDVFFTGHGTKNEDGNPAIGEEDGDFAMNGGQLWTNFSSIFPDDYTGDIYLRACETADPSWDSFSLAEQVKAFTVSDGCAAGVYGRNGNPWTDDPISKPGDGWTEAV